MKLCGKAGRPWWLRCRTGLAAVAMLLAAAATLVGLSSTTTAAKAKRPGPRPPFSPGSPFNTRLPARPLAATNGGGLATVGRSVNSSEYSPIVYTATPTGTPVRIELKEQGSWGDNPLDGRVVNLPAGVGGGSDGDGHVTIVVPYEDVVISLFQAEAAPRPDGTWWATWGGMGHLSGDGGNLPNAKGGRESGISQLAGLITPADVRRGIAAGPKGDLGHALAIGYPDVSDSVFVPPAVRPGGTSTSPQALYMGQKIYLDPRVHVSRINWRIRWVSTPRSERFSRLIARTLQRYGAVVVSNSPVMSFQMVNPRSWTSRGLRNPWPSLIGRSSGGYYGFTVRNIPGSALRALAPTRTLAAGR